MENIQTFANPSLFYFKLMPYTVVEIIMLIFLRKKSLSMDV